MILQISILILTIVMSYILIQLIPELKKWLLKEHPVQQTHHINNITIPKSEMIPFSGHYEIPCNNPLETPVIKEIPPEEKMANIFANPSLKPLKTNFTNLGEVKKVKKTSNSEIEQIRGSK